MNKNRYKRILPQRLSFPAYLKFTPSDNGLLQCKGKLVQVIPSLPIDPSDNPPINISISGIGRFVFNLSDADIMILSFVNSHTHKTDCAILVKELLLGRLKDYHHDNHQLNLKLILTDRGLYECYNAGAEAFFMGLWIDETRDFTGFYNNWSAFDD